MSVASTSSGQVVAALAKLNTWIEAEGFRGWDPYDALNSPLLRWVGRQRLLAMVMVQLLRRSPVNVRPTLKIQKDHNPKAMGLFLATYAQKFIASQEEEHLRKVQFFSNWLLERASPGYAGLCWGYNFDWANRSFLAPANTPTIVNTAFIALAFLAAQPALAAVPARAGNVASGDCCTKLGVHHGRNIDSWAIARSACEFILRDLRTLQPNSDEICFSYTPIDRRFVHNANLLGAWLLAAVYTQTGEEDLAENAKSAARFSARRQFSDGSWPYGIARNDRWVDNFHTGYVLVSLKKIGGLLDTSEFDAVVYAGYRFWKRHMLFDNYIPKHSPSRVYPVDIHSVAQAILTFLEFCDSDPGAISLACDLATWAVANMQDEHGFFYYQLKRSHKIRIPYMRWAQAWMQVALLRLVCTITKHRL